MRFEGTDESGEEDLPNTGPGRADLDGWDGSRERVCQLSDLNPIQNWGVFFFYGVARLVLNPVFYQTGYLSASAPPTISISSLVMAS